MKPWIQPELTKKKEGLQSSSPSAPYNSNVISYTWPEHTTKHLSIYSPPVSPDKGWHRYSVAPAPSVWGDAGRALLSRRAWKDAVASTPHLGKYTRHFLTQFWPPRQFRTRSVLNFPVKIWNCTLDIRFSLLMCWCIWQRLALWATLELASTTLVRDSWITVMH